MSSAAERGDRAEHAERDRFGFDGAFSLRDLDGSPHCAAAPPALLRERIGDVGCDARCVAVPAVNHDRRFRDERTTRHELPHQCRCEQYPVVAERFDVVFDELGVEHDDPDQFEVDLQMRRRKSCSGRRLQSWELLRVRIEANRQDRSDAHAKLTRCTRVHDDFVRSRRDRPTDHSPASRDQSSSTRRRGCHRLLVAPGRATSECRALREA